MAQNKSSAVMQQRAHRAPSSLDYFPTPPWATRALCEFLRGAHWGRRSGQWSTRGQSVWEPACGEGFMARPLGEYFNRVRATDVFDYGGAHLLQDFLQSGPDGLVDWIVTNPPFKLSLQFVERALALASCGVAMLVRTSWLEGASRFRDVFAPTPPTFVLQFSQRVVMLEGRLIRDGAPDPFNLDPATGLPRKASTATSYAWVIWERAGGEWQGDTRHRWVPPIRVQLERPGDYPDHSALIAEIESRVKAQDNTAQAGLI